MTPYDGSDATAKYTMYGEIKTHACSWSINMQQYCFSCLPLCLICCRPAHQERRQLLCLTIRTFYILLFIYRLLYMQYNIVQYMLRNDVICLHQCTISALPFCSAVLCHWWQSYLRWCQMTVDCTTATTKRTTTAVTAAPATAQADVHWVCTLDEMCGVSAQNI